MSITCSACSIPPAAAGTGSRCSIYSWTLPLALLPWLLPLIEALRPAHWRRVRLAGLPRLADPARYGALMSATMLLLLSASATKRETYLLPILPLLFLWLGIRTYEWWQHWQLLQRPRLGAGWWLQTLLLAVYALAAPISAWIWLHGPNAWIVGTLLIALLCVSALLYCSVTGQRLRAGPAALACAIAGSAIVLTLAPVLLDNLKDMGPFVRSIGELLPPGQPVYALRTR